MLPTLRLVHDLGGSTSKGELEQRIASAANLNPGQLAVGFPKSSSHYGKSKVIYRSAWARTNLKLIGALDNSARGVWSITPKGRAYLDMAPSAATAALMAEVRAARKESAKPPEQPANVKALPLAAEDDGRDIDGAGENWRVTLSETLKKMDPQAFERLSTRILKEAGFRKVEVLGKAGDGGIDGVGVYKVSLVSFPTYFQCKRYAGSVSAGAVRDFRGAMTGRGEKGLLITTGTFTPAARAEATRDGAPPIDLIDGDELCDLIMEYRLGVDVNERVVQDVIVDTNFFDNL